MKKLFALTVILFTCATPFAFAGAEDYSAKDTKKMVMPVAPPPCDWTGFYVGGSLGWRGGDSKWDYTYYDGREFSSTVSQNFESGFIIGAQTGYNRQINSWFVVGAELTGSWSTNFGPDASQIYSDGSGDEYKYTTDNDFTGTLGLRIGVTALHNKMLFYAKGGGAVTHWNFDYVEDYTADYGYFDQGRWHSDKTIFSPMVGAGIEYAINCHWSARVEWMHLFIDDQSETSNLTYYDSGGAYESYKVTFKQELNYDSVQLGLNYKF